MAIILANYSDQLQLLGISTVFGNQTLKKITINALKMHYVAGLSPVSLPKHFHKAPLTVKGKRK